MPYAGPFENEWATISLTFNNNNNNNNDNNNNNKKQTNFSINHNNINENASSSSTSTFTTTTTTTFSTTTTNNNSKTFPLSSSLQDYKSNNITISSSYNASNIEATSRHKFSSSFQPEFLTASSRRKSAPEFLKPLLIPQKNFQHEDDQLIIIKKKNGDIVKPSLKKKSKSEPNTPMLPKYVHFNADLEQIRLFREAQEPQAVSADVTSDESDEDDDDDFVFSDDDDDDGYYRNFIDQEPELTITLPNMPLITTLHSSKPVYVDSIFLSKDKNKLQGRIMVQNIAFHKLVEVRYTFDFWQTVSEVKATYAEGVADKDKDSFDIFTFSIELFDNSRNLIDGKTMYFAVHYNVSNRDYWDNNSGSNYRVDFKKVKKSSSSSQCNHHCYRQNSKVNSNHNINQGSLPKLSSTAIATNSSSSRKWPIIPSTPANHLPKKSLSDDCHSPPNSTTHTSIADSRKKGVAGRYDIGVSLSAAQNNPRSFNNNSNANNININNKNINKINNNNSATTLSSSPISSSPFTNSRTNYCYQTPYFPTLAISCDYKSFSSGSCYIDGMPVTTETAPLSSSSLQWEGSPKKSFGGLPLMSSNPIAIPTTKSSTNSYYDHIVSQYCFSSGSPYATAVLASSPYASSPPVM